MKYYVTGCIAGCIDEDCGFSTLEEAIKKRDEWNREDGKSGYWIVVDEDGREVE